MPESLPLKKPKKRKRIDPAIIRRCEEKKNDPMLLSSLYEAALWSMRIEDLMARLKDERPEWKNVREAWQKVRERNDWNKEQFDCLKEYWEAIHSETTKDAAYDKTFAQIERATDKKQAAVAAEMQRMEYCNENVPRQEFKRIFVGFMDAVVGAVRGTLEKPVADEILKQIRRDVARLITEPNQPKGIIQQAVGIEEAPPAIMQEATPRE